MVSLDLMTQWFSIFVAYLVSGLIGLFFHFGTLKEDLTLTRLGLVLCHFHDKWYMVT